MQQYAELAEKAMSSPTALWVMLVSGIIFFTLMTREVVLWFFRLTTMMNKLDEIQKTLARIDVRLKNIEPGSSVTATVSDAPAIEETPQSNAKPKLGSNFPLQH